MRISDWSSDVCSSDLSLRDKQSWPASVAQQARPGLLGARAWKEAPTNECGVQCEVLRGQSGQQRLQVGGGPQVPPLEQRLSAQAGPVSNDSSAPDRAARPQQIGRASCRERVWQNV